MRGRTLQWLMLVLCLLLVVGPAEARKKRRSLPKWEWSLLASAGFTYDDNVLGFSERDQNQFLRDPAAFPTPLESVDDLESSVSVKPSVQWRAPLSLMVSGDYRIKAVHRVRNEFSDYQTHTAGVSVRPRVIGYPWMARVRVLAIPSYYLRVYRDRDFGEYDATRYANWDYAASLRYRVASPLWLEGGVSYGTYYYNRKFTEYDSEYWDYSLGGSYEAPREIRVSVNYTRRLSDNVGKNQTGALAPAPSADGITEDTEYGDADYHEDDVSASVSAPVVWVKIAPTEASVAYRHRRRVYLTDRSLLDDPFHRGRLDNRGQWTFSIRTSLSRHWDVEGFFSYESRISDSKEPAVPLAKSFVRRETGVVFTYLIR